VPKLGRNKTADLTGVPNVGGFFVCLKECLQKTLEDRSKVSLDLLARAINFILVANVLQQVPNDCEVPRQDLA